MAVKEIMPTKRVIGKSPRRIKVLALVCTACTCGFQSQFHFIVNLFAFNLQNGLSPRAFLALFNALKSAKSMHFASLASAFWLKSGSKKLILYVPASLDCRRCLFWGLRF